MDAKPVLVRAISTDSQGNEVESECIGTVTNIHISAEGVLATFKTDDDKLIKGKIMSAFSIRNRKEDNE